jgi:DNA mismatch repair protein MSH4
MREMAFILRWVQRTNILPRADSMIIDTRRNVDCRSIAIIDELGRGTNTRDGLSIALAMSEALIQSKALVWFATHFKELGIVSLLSANPTPRGSPTLTLPLVADILSDRPGVMNLHLATATRRQNGAISGMTMLYKVASGVVRDDHYGIALAKTMGFPDSFVSFAERVANDLSRKREAAKQSSEAAKLVKKRKLVLNLDETLRRVVDAGMETGALWGFLERLQGEFVDKMAGLEEEDIEQGVEGGEERDGMEIDDDEGEGSTSGDEDMEDEM